MAISDLSMNSQTSAWHGDTLPKAEPPQTVDVQRYLSPGLESIGGVS